MGCGDAVLFCPMTQCAESGRAASATATALVIAVIMFLRVGCIVFPPQPDKLMTILSPRWEKMHPCFYLLKINSGAGCQNPVRKFDNFSTRI
jgi:hypothetical protein